ncbi:MAG: hypothetical protein K6C99_04225 [Lachnospiraceae bacterium]|nr:hypothetical protein [Lachnospiraceae bacterium]
MNRRETEEKLKKACYHAAPDVLKDVKARLENASEEDAVVPMNLKQKRHTRYSVFVPAVLSGAAALLLVCNVALLVAGKNNENRAVRTVALELNPGVELGVNSDGRVVNVKTLDKSSEEMISKMDLNGTNADVAVNAIVGAMYQSGSLGDNQTAVATVEVAGTEETAVQPATGTDETGSEDVTVATATTSSDKNNDNNDNKPDTVSDNGITEDATVSSNTVEKIDMSTLKKHDESGANTAYHIALRDAGVSVDQVTEHSSSWQLEEEDPEFDNVPTPKSEIKASESTGDQIKEQTKASSEAEDESEIKASAGATATPSVKASAEATETPSVKASAEATATPSVKASTEATATPSVKASAKTTERNEQITGGFYLVTFKTARYTYIYMIDEDGGILSVSRSVI